MSEPTSGAGAEPATGTDPGPSGLTPFLQRPWVRAVRWGLAAGALAAVALPMVVLFPYVRDDLALDRAVRAAALDWRDFGEERARDRLEYELDHQGIGPWVSDQDCGLGTTAAVRTIACVWSVAIPIPGTDLVLPVHFSSRAAIGADGDLR